MNAAGWTISIIAIVAVIALGTSPRRQ